MTANIGYGVFMNKVVRVDGVVFSLRLLTYNIANSTIISLSNTSVKLSCLIFQSLY